VQHLLVLSAQAAGALLTLKQGPVVGLGSCSLGGLLAVCAAAFCMVGLCGRRRVDVCFAAVEVVSCESCWSVCEWSAAGAAGQNSRCLQDMLLAWTNILLWRSVGCQRMPAHWQCLLLGMWLGALLDGSCVLGRPVLPVRGLFGGGCVG
jgi:hypothetical protein